MSRFVGRIKGWTRNVWRTGTFHGGLEIEARGNIGVMRINCSCPPRRHTTETFKISVAKMGDRGRAGYRDVDPVVVCELSPQQMIALAERRGTLLFFEEASNE